MRTTAPEANGLLGLGVNGNGNGQGQRIGLKELEQQHIATGVVPTPDQIFEAWETDQATHTTGAPAEVDTAEATLADAELPRLAKDTLTVPLYEPGSLEEFLVLRATRERAASRRLERYSRERRTTWQPRPADANKSRDPHFSVMPFAKGMMRKAHFLPEGALRTV